MVSVQGPRVPVLVGFFRLGDDRVQRSQRGHKTSDLNDSHSISRMPWDKKPLHRTSSKHRPTKFIPQSTTTTPNPSRITISPLVHGLCPVTTMHKAALPFPAEVAINAPHASHMHTMPCSLLTGTRRHPNVPIVEQLPKHGHFSRDS